MLVSVYLRLDILKDTLLEIRTLSQHAQILRLFHFDHLNECLAYLPVICSNMLIHIKGDNGSPLFFEKHVHFTDSIDGVRLLPDEL